MKLSTTRKVNFFRYNYIGNNNNFQRNNFKNGKNDLNVDYDEENNKKNVKFGKLLKKIECFEKNYFNKKIFFLFLMMMIINIWLVILLMK